MRLLLVVFAIVLLNAIAHTQQPSSRPPDTDRNGIPDLLQTLLGVSLRQTFAELPQSCRRSRYTSGLANIKANGTGGKPVPIQTPRAAADTRVESKYLREEGSQRGCSTIASSFHKVSHSGVG